MVQQTQVEHGCSAEVLRAARFHLCSSQGLTFEAWDAEWDGSLVAHHLSCLRQAVPPWAGCHLGWKSAVDSPLRGGRGDASNIVEPDPDLFRSNIICLSGEPDSDPKTMSDPDLDIWLQIQISCENNYLLLNKGTFFIN